MDLLAYLAAVSAAAILGASLMAIVSARNYDRGWADGAREAIARRQHARPRAWPASEMNQAALADLDALGIGFGREP